MNIHAYAITGALIGTAVLAAVGYWSYYAIRNAKNPSALSPAEAWVVARYERRNLDTELAKILRDTAKD